MTTRRTGHRQSIRVSWHACLAACVLFSGTVDSTSFAQSEPAPPTGRFVDHIYKDADGEHKYVVFEPVGYTPDKEWPLVFYLHGASGRGRDGRAQLVVGLGPAVKTRADKLPFLVVFPQNENLKSRLLGGWNDGSDELPRALKILDEVERNYSVNRKHEVLVGVSMGAFGVWEVAANSPERWRAMIAVSGGGEPEFVPALTKVPIWAFHAADDQLVPPSRSSDMVRDINAAGGRAYVSILPDGGHNIGARVLARDEVFEWMEHPDTMPRTDIDWSQRIATADMTDEVRFIPGADVASAGRIRLNRDLLESLSYVVADRLPADALQGWKPGRTETQRAGIATLNVHVGNMHYTGHLEQAWITPQASGQLRVQLALRALTMTITGTQLQGRLISAQAGPMAIYIGHAEPVWMTIDVTPKVVDRRLKMQLDGVQFQIPNHNWSISRPGVNVRGLRFLEGTIAGRLVDGVAEKKWMIEDEIRNSVPQMLVQLEQRVAEFCERTVTYRQWPMPLWQPRFRFYPESIAIDEQGIDLKLGAIVAALAPKTPNPTVLQFPADGEELPSPPTTGLDLSVSRRLVDAYSTLLINSDVAGFHVLDMNGAEFRQLGKHEFWNSVLPENRQLPATTELNTEFLLVRPFEFIPQPGTGEQPDAAGLLHQMALRIPQMQLRLATRNTGEKDWKDYATADLAFDQAIRLELEKPSFSQRKLGLSFSPIKPPEVKGTFLTGDPNDMLDTARIAEIFQDGWSKNFGQRERDGSMPDVKFGQFVLRWQDIGGTASHYVIRLQRPGIRVYNRSVDTVEYQVRGTLTPWSEVLRLAPNAFHEFNPATPLTWRAAQHPDVQNYTLPLGFEAQVRNGEGNTLLLFQEGKATQTSQLANQPYE